MPNTFVIKRLRWTANEIFLGPLSRNGQLESFRDDDCPTEGDDDCLSEQ
jgi:hypothetical protein